MIDHSDLSVAFRWSIRRGPNGTGKDRYTVRVLQTKDNEYQVVIRDPSAPTTKRLGESMQLRSASAQDDTG